MPICGELGLERRVALGGGRLAIFGQRLLEQARSTLGTKRRSICGQALLGRQPVAVLVAALALRVGLLPLLGPAIEVARRAEQLRARQGAHADVVERALVGFGDQRVEPAGSYIARALGIGGDPGAILRFLRVLAGGSPIRSAPAISPRYFFL
jgi:hypothetical protein